jgi:hypothetical protein
MKKAVVALFMLTFMISFALAQTNQTNPIDKAYQCLQDELEEKTVQALSLEEAIFSMLALGSREKLQTKINQDKNANEPCWPAQSCALKETAQVLLAYDRINRNADAEAIADWLMSKNTSTTNINWFLQIDISTHTAAECTITYDGTPKTVNIGENMVISGNAGPCFATTQSGYWLQVQPNCFDKEFAISCNQDFVTSLLYQRPGSSTIYISPNTHSSASAGQTREKVNSKCLRAGNTCDYEGNLWAAMALTKKGKDISSLLPYLTVFAEDNQRFFPSAFIYTVTQGEDQYSNIVQAQRQNQFWEAPGSPNRRFYDSSLAFLALQGASSQEAENSKTYFQGIQTPQGCWDNNHLRNTAFLLYSGWPRTIVSPGPNGNGGTIDLCPTEQCMSTFACGQNEGQILPGLQCSGTQVCCSVAAQQQTCAAQSGTICTTSQTCSGQVVPSIESGTCCVGTCQAIPPEPPNECLDIGGACRFSCGPGEEQFSYSCGTSTGSICCLPSTPSGGNGGGMMWLIIMLIILIALLALGIIYRRKLQLWIFKAKDRNARPSGAPGGPRYPPAYPPAMRRPQYGPRPGMPPQGPRQAPQRTQSKEDKELEETMKKLKEMGN